MRSFRSFVIALVLSALTHVVLVAVLLALPRPQPHGQYVTVDFVPPKNASSAQGKTIVRDHSVPDKLRAEDSNDPLKFWSAQNQRVRQQMRAALTGKTANRSLSQGKETQEKNSTSQRSLSSDEGLPQPEYKRKPSEDIFAKGLALERGLSTTGEALPKDMAVGSFTALNTDRFVFYSFFSRIEDLVRFPWENMVRSALQNSPQVQSYNRGLWTTQIEVRVKPSGHLDSVVLMKPSGIDGLDQAAIQAFRQARFLPNPPAEMVESDGLIHLKYAFQVRYEPKALAGH